MPDTVTDRLIEGALQALLRDPAGWRSVVRDLAAAEPEASPAHLIFALVSAATMIEEIFAAGSPSRDAAAQAMRMAALVGADLFAMEALHLPRATNADLLAYWKKHDPWFLTL